MQTWQQSLSQAITDVDELLAVAEIPLQQRQAFMQHQQFPLLVTREYASRIAKGDAQDPLLLQVIPQQQEQQQVAGFSEDPLAEADINPVPGLLHRYPGRVLLTLTGACPVHCRYCFRRHFPYAANNPLKSNLSKVIDYIQQDNSIEEVIFSGGDPLLLSDQQLQRISQMLAKIPHIKRLRFHTRVPILLPSRINQPFLDWMGSLPFDCCLVIHCNHPNELDSDVLAAMHALKPYCQLLNQSVLLAQINNQVDILAVLSRKLFSSGVLPYYLHALDAVAGAAHFAVSETDGQAIIQQLSAILPGYLVPKFVKTVAESRQKVSLLG